MAIHLGTPLAQPEPVQSTMTDSKQQKMPLSPSLTSTSLQTTLPHEPQGAQAVKKDTKQIQRKKVSRKKDASRVKRGPDVAPKDLG